MINDIIDVALGILLLLFAGVAFLSAVVLVAVPLYLLTV